MKVNVHAGHNPDGKIACGACGILKESTENRKVVKYIKKYLKNCGVTVYDCTCNNGYNASDVLNKIVKKCNTHNVDLDVSIHFNSGAKDEKGNGKTTGTEVLIYSDYSKPKKEAQEIASTIAELGFTNRGIKVRPDLRVLNSTKSPALLVECCFVDDKDDAKVYNAKKMAAAIVEGVINSQKEVICKTIRKISQFKKPGKDKTKAKVKKGAEIVIDKIKIENGVRYGRIKTSRKWIKLKYTNHASRF